MPFTTATPWDKTFNLSYEGCRCRYFVDWAVVGRARAVEYVTFRTVVVGIIRMKLHSIRLHTASSERNRNWSRCALATPNVNAPHDYRALRYLNGAQVLSGVTTIYAGEAENSAVYSFAAAHWLFLSRPEFCHKIPLTNPRRKKSKIPSPNL